MVLVTVHVQFDCAGSRKTVVVVLGRVIFPENSCVKWLLWHVQLHFNCAGSRKMVVSVLGRGIFLRLLV